MYWKGKESQLHPESLQHQQGLLLWEMCLPCAWEAKLGWLPDPLALLCNLSAPFLWGRGSWPSFMATETKLMQSMPPSRGAGAALSSLVPVAFPSQNPQMMKLQTWKRTRNYRSGHLIPSSLTKWVCSCLFGVLVPAKGLPKTSHRSKPNWASTQDY